MPCQRRKDALGIMAEQRRPTLDLGRRSVELPMRRLGANLAIGCSNPLHHRIGADLLILKQDVGLTAFALVNAAGYSRRTQPLDPFGAMPVRENRGQDRDQFLTMRDSEVVGDEAF